MTPAPERMLIVSLPAWNYATRTRKAARQYAASGADVTFLALSAVGRSGQWDKPGQWTDGTVQIVHLPSPTPSTGTSTWARLRNALLVYGPGFARLAVRVWRTRASVVHVTGGPLAILGVLHALRHRSSFVLDLDERPMSATARGSLITTFRRVERPALRLAARFADLTLAVCAGHAREIRTIGFDPVLVVRNVPDRDWKASYRPPDPLTQAPLRVVTASSIFEGRGFEALIRAIRVVRADLPVQLRVIGSGRADYLAELQTLIDDLDLHEDVELIPRVEREAVSAAYLDGHLGLAIYEGHDPSNDSLSNKLLETVATGRPVLAADNPQNRAFLRDYPVGWLVDVTVDGIAAGIRSAADADLPAISAQCRAVGDAEFTWEQEFTPVVSAVATLENDRRSRSRPVWRRRRRHTPATGPG